MTQIRILIVSLSLVFTALIGNTAHSTAQSGQASSGAAATLRHLSLVPIQVVYRQNEGTYLKSPRGVFVDRNNGDIYVADTANNLIAVYNRDGVPVLSIGYNKELREPFKAVADPTGRIYVLDGIPRKVKIFSYRGEYQGDFPYTGLEKEPDPIAIAVDDAGNVYIADNESKQIFVYDSAYRPLVTIGSKQDGSSYFRSVQGIAIDLEGNIYVVDASAAPVQVFNRKGKFLRAWGEHATGPQNFSLPSGVAIDKEGRVIVVDTLRHAVSAFTQAGDFIGRYGGFGSQPGAVAYPTDIAAGRDGRIYVVERVGSRLQIWEQRTQNVSKGGDTSTGFDPMRQKVRSDIKGFIKNMR